MESFRRSVTVTPTLLVKGTEGVVTRAVINNTGPGSVFLGGADVTATGGFQLAPADAALPVTLWHADELWAVRTGAGTTTVHVLVARG
jgi:hypothetical protein